MKTLEEYKEMFNLRDEEIKEFESFLQDKNQSIYYSKFTKIVKYKNGDIAGYGLVPPEKKNDFMKNFENNF